VIAERSWPVRVIVARMPPKFALGKRRDEGGRPSRAGGCEGEATPHIGMPRTEGALDMTRTGDYIRNGLVRRSAPMVVLGPCPGCTRAPSPKENSTVRIEAINVA
jgi:hypothetical protein